MCIDPRWRRNQDGYVNGSPRSAGHDCQSAVALLPSRPAVSLDLGCRSRLGRPRRAEIARRRNSGCRRCPDVRSTNAPWRDTLRRWRHRRSRGERIARDRTSGTDKAQADHCRLECWSSSTHLCAFHRRLQRTFPSVARHQDVVVAANMSGCCGRLHGQLQLLFSTHRRADCGIADQRRQLADRLYDETIPLGP